MRVPKSGCPRKRTGSAAGEKPWSGGRGECFGPDGRFSNALLATLPEAQREALHLAFYCGLSQREIAAKTGIPLGTIKTRLELAVRKMRAGIMAIGGAEEWSLARA